MLSWLLVQFGLATIENNEEKNRETPPSGNIKRRFVFIITKISRMIILKVLMYNSNINSF